MQEQKTHHSKKQAEPQNPRTKKQAPIRSKKGDLDDTEAENVMNSSNSEDDDMNKHNTESRDSSPLNSALVHNVPKTTQIEGVGAA